MATLDELRDMRANGRTNDMVLALMDDMIERRESGAQTAANAGLLTFCRVDVARAGHVQHVTLTHQPTGLKAAGSTQPEALAALWKALVTTFGDRPDFNPNWR